MKRYRDEAGKLTMTLDQFAQATKAEADSYFLDGAFYVRSDNNQVYQFLKGPCSMKNGTGEIFLDPEKLGTFLPDVGTINFKKV